MWLQQYPTTDFFPQPKQAFGHSYSCPLNQIDVWHLFESIRGFFVGEWLINGALQNDCFVSNLSLDLYLLCSHNKSIFLQFGRTISLVLSGIFFKKMSDQLYITQDNNHFARSSVQFYMVYFILYFYYRRCVSLKEITESLL